MTAAALIDRAKVDGVTIALDPAGKIKVRGDDAAVSRWLPEVRAHKRALVSLLSEPEAHRLWSITLPSGERFTSSYCPPATRAEVQAWHPGAKVEARRWGQPQHPTDLSHADEAAVRSWLSSIGESDPAIIGETLTRCRSSTAALAYFVGRAQDAAAVPALTEPRHARWIATYADHSVEVLEGNPINFAEALRRRPGALTLEPEGTRQRNATRTQHRMPPIRGSMRPPPT